MRARPQWHVHMRVGGENVQIDLTEKFDSYLDVVQWVSEYFQDDAEWITLPQVGEASTVVTMIRRKEVKILTIKYW